MCKPKVTQDIEDNNLSEIIINLTEGVDIRFDVVCVFVLVIIKVFDKYQFCVRNMKHNTKYQHEILKYKQYYQRIY